MSYKIYSDGCHLAEFSVAGAGGYLLKDNITVFEFSEKIEQDIYYKNHERFAIKRVLEKSLEEGIENEIVEFFSDDQGLMKILAKPNRRDYIKENNLLMEICDLCDKFTNINFNYIPRSENARADKLSRQNIIETIFKHNQITLGSFSHPKWISKNNFPKDSRDFSLEKQSINDYLVVHFHPNKPEKCMQLDIYYAKRENDNISYEIIETVQTINKGWAVACVNAIDKHLKQIAQDNKNIGLVLHDEYIMLDQMLRGRKDIPAKAQKAFENLTITLEDLDKVIVHREPLVYEAIFKDNPKKMKAKISKSIA